MSEWMNESMCMAGSMASDAAEFGGYVLVCLMLGFAVVDVALGAWHYLMDMDTQGVSDV